MIEYIQAIADISLSECNICQLTLHFGEDAAAKKDLY
jgi:hypothetical protein